MSTFANDVILSRYEQGADNSSGRAMTVKSQTGPKEPAYGRFPSCASCYRPVRDQRTTYCESCRESGAAFRHRQMRVRLGDAEPVDRDPGGRPRKLDYEAAWKLREQGLTLAAIGERLGVNAKTVGHAIRKMQRTRAA